MEQQIDRDRLSVLTGAILLALALSRLLELPDQAMASTTALGSPLGIRLTATLAMALLVMSMAVTAADALVRSHPLGRRGALPYTHMAWLVPGLLGLGLTLWLSQVAATGLWTLLLLLSAIPLVVVLSAEFAAADEEQRQGTLLQWAHLTVAYLTALLLFTLIYDARMRTLLGGSMIVISSTLLAWRLFWPAANGERLPSFLYGAAVGVIMGQMSWVLNYWRLSGLQGGLLLLLLFYVLVGLLEQGLRRQLTLRSAAEYGVLGAFALLVIMLAL